MHRVTCSTLSVVRGPRPQNKRPDGFAGSLVDLVIDQSEALQAPVFSTIVENRLSREGFKFLHQPRIFGTRSVNQIVQTLVRSEE